MSTEEPTQQLGRRHPPLDDKEDLAEMEPDLTQLARTVASRAQVYFGM